MDKQLYRHVQHHEWTKMRCGQTSTQCHKRGSVNQNIILH